MEWGNPVIYWPAGGGAEEPANGYHETARYVHNGIADLGPDGVAVGAAVLGAISLPFRNQRYCSQDGHASQQRLGTLTTEKSRCSSFHVRRHFRTSCGDAFL